MKNYFFKKILQEDGWQNDSYITVDEDNIIVKISTEKPDQEFFPMGGYLIPGFKNAHSHSFQYAMAGMNESIPESANGDDFWSWSENMYSLALSITPEQLQDIATNLYMECVVTVIPMWLSFITSIMILKAFHIKSLQK